MFIVANLEQNNKKIIHYISTVFNRQPCYIRVITV